MGSSRRSGMGDKSSKSVWASLAGPRRVPNACTRTTRISLACAKVNTSSMRTACAGLVTRLLLIRTCPALTTLAASDLVLKNRPCQSHLSSLIFCSLSESCKANLKSCSSIPLTPRQMDCPDRSCPPWPAWQNTVWSLWDLFHEACRGVWIAWPCSLVGHLCDVGGWPR